MEPGLESGEAVCPETPCNSDSVHLLSLSSIATAPAEMSFVVPSLCWISESGPAVPEVSRVG